MNVKQVTMKDNKLIAEFMGWKPNEHHWCLNGDKDLQYHTSWDWLMPVIEKIEEIAIEDDNLTIKEHRYQVDMSYTQCNIYDYVRDGVIASADMGTKLSSTHRAVIEFIKEYNNG